MDIYNRQPMSRWQQELHDKAIKDKARQEAALETLRLANKKGYWIER